MDPTETAPPDSAALRHPEKRRRQASMRVAKPDWIRVRAPGSKQFARTRERIHRLGLKTVCEEASCPNIGECWDKSHATIMIMGEICTRGCAFCNVTTGIPGNLDPTEPERVAIAAAELALEHIVVTSVDRDDLPDGGAGHFVRVIEAMRAARPEMTLEVLTPDFRDKPGAVALLAGARPDVFNHNLETVPRLYPSIRPGARYFTSLELLASYRRLHPQGFTKSGLMVGLGETFGEITQVMDDLRAARVDFLTIGQYLQPTPQHAPIDRFVPPDEFNSMAEYARGKGFLLVSASPLTRSSYHAGEDFARLRRERERRTAAVAESH